MRSCCRCGQLAELKARNLCPRCYRRVRTLGRLNDYPSTDPRWKDPSDTRPVIERRIVRLSRGLGADQCWPWDGTLHYKGYGLLHGGEKAHRAAYSHYHGRIDEEQVVDHNCHNLDPDCHGGNLCPHRRCVNPAHLVLRSAAENSTIGQTTRGQCANGHARTAENRYTHGGHDYCRLCHLERAREATRLERRAAGVPERRDDVCGNGHEWTSENTNYDYRGTRRCVTCQREYQARYYLEVTKPRREARQRANEGQASA